MTLLEQGALDLVLRQPLQRVRADLRPEGETWRQWSVGSACDASAWIELDSNDGDLMHVVRARVLEAAPAAVRAVLLVERAVFRDPLPPAGQSIFTDDEARELAGLIRSVKASLEGRS